MFEKYNVSAISEECSAGSGGEYEVQVVKILKFKNQNLF